MVNKTIAYYGTVIVGHYKQMKSLCLRLGSETPSFEDSVELFVPVQPGACPLDKKSGYTPVRSLKAALLALFQPA